MDPVELLRGLRRRWWIIALTVGVSVVASFFTTKVAPPPKLSTSYVATVVMLRSESSSGISNMNTLAALIGIGEIPKRVAAAVDFKGDPATLGSQVQALWDADTGLFRITARSSDDPKAAEELVGAFASEMLGFLHENRAKSLAAQVESLGPRLDELKLEIDALDNQVARASGSERQLLSAQRDAKVRNYGLVYEEYQRLASVTVDEGGGPGLEIIEEATARPVVSAAGGFSAPRSRTTRMAFGGIVGLLAGVALVLVLERFDTRIRNKEQAEEHFGLPVIAEIPRFRRGKQKKMLETGSDRSVTHDAYRLLGVGVTSRPVFEDGRLAPSTRVGRASKTILVTSSGAGEGKSTVVANLARTYAELGKTVVALSCDFRRPRLHEMFGLDNAHGLADILISPEAPAAMDGQVIAVEPGLRVVPSGPPPINPSELLGSEKMKKVIADARQSADIVLIDTAPVLTGDTPHLLDDVDAVLVVVRAGRTRSEIATRARDLLKRLGAPVVGVALNAASEMPRRFGYYYGYRPQRVKRRDRIRGKSHLPRHSEKV